MATVIKVNPNGSLRIEGDFSIVDAEGTPFDLQGRSAVSLCRCNLSKNRPFCDGSHKGCFEHDVKAFSLPPLPKKEG